MAGSSVNAGGSHRTGLLLWLFPPLFELPVVLVMCSGFDEVAREAVLGTPGTQLALAAVLVVVAVGAVVAWRGAVGSARVVTAALLFVAAGVTGALLIGFLTGGAYVIIAVLLAHSAVSLAMIGRAVLRATPTAGR